MPTKEIHPKRWQVTAAFVALVVVFSFGLWKVQHDSASIQQLQHTNCSLKKFLVTAELTRNVAAKHETGEKRRADLLAAHGYHRLAVNFQDGAIGTRCELPASTP